MKVEVFATIKLNSIILQGLSHYKLQSVSKYSWFYTQVKINIVFAVKLLFGYQKQSYLLIASRQVLKLNTKTN